MSLSSGPMRPCRRRSVHARRRDHLAGQQHPVPGRLRRCARPCRSRIASWSRSGTRYNGEARARTWATRRWPATQRCTITDFRGRAGGALTPYIENSITVWAEDRAGLQGSDTVTFSFAPPTPTLTLNLIADDVEIIQVIQCMDNPTCSDNSVPLYVGKPTLVRLYVRAEGAGAETAGIGGEICVAGTCQALAQPGDGLGSEDPGPRLPRRHQPDLEFPTSDGLGCVDGNTTARSSSTATATTSASAASTTIAWSAVSPSARDAAWTW